VNASCEARRLERFASVPPCGGGCLDERDVERSSWNRGFVASSCLPYEDAKLFSGRDSSPFKITNEAGAERVVGRARANGHHRVVRVVEDVILGERSEDGRSR
jgi:hypothetical protein